MPKFATLAIGALTFFMLGSAEADLVPAPSASAAVEAWRHAIHWRPTSKNVTARARYALTQEGLNGSDEFLVRQDGAFRESVDRHYDSSTTQLLAGLGSLRDWDGYVRSIEGAELRRARTRAFAVQTILFGPSRLFQHAQLGESEDHSAWILRITPPGGNVVVWYVDRQSGLPQKSVMHGGNDRDITTTYADWREGPAGLTPFSIEESGDLTGETLILSNSPEFAPRRRSDFEQLPPGPSDVEMTADEVRVPFTMEANHIVAPISVNGSPPIGFIFDTGDNNELINGARLAQLGLTSYGAVTEEGGGHTADGAYVQDVTLSAPGATLRHQHAVILDLTGLERALGVPIGGLLGYDFISRFVVEIDYASRTMILHRPDGWRYKGRGGTTPLVFDSGIPYTDVVLSAPTKPRLAAHMVVDFGAADTMTFTSPFVAANDLMRLAGTSPRVNEASGLQNEFFAQRNRRGRIDALQLAGITLRAIPVSFSANTSGAYASPDFAGTIGQGVYTRFHVFLDYARKRLILEKLPDTEAPFPERRTFGLRVLAEGDDLHTFLIAGIRQDSPASAAGFTTGDIIVAVDGRSARDILLSQLNDMLSEEGARHILRIRRGSGEIDMPVTISLVSIEH